MFREVASSTATVTAHLTDILLSALEDTQVSSDILDVLFDFLTNQGAVCGLTLLCG